MRALDRMEWIGVGYVVAMTTYLGLAYGVGAACAMLAASAFMVGVIVAVRQAF